MAYLCKNERVRGSLQKKKYKKLLRLIKVRGILIRHSGNESIKTHWRFSSVGRASALQAEGQRFDPVNSHHKNNSVMIMVPWCSGYHVALSRRRSRVRFPSGPYDSLAQLVEQLTFNQWVTGSSPVRVIILCGFGGIGRRTRFRIWRLTAWGFKSLNPH